MYIYLGTNVLLSYTELSSPWCFFYRDICGKHNVGQLVCISVYVYVYVQWVGGGLGLEEELKFFLLFSIYFFCSQYYE